MDPVTLSGIFSIGSKLIERLFPDKEKANEAKLKLMQMQQDGELAKLAADTELAKGQIEVNKAEAQSGSLFVAGWRPGIGWICGIGLAYSFIIQPFLGFVAFLGGVDLSKAPDLDTGALLTLVLGMLGLGASRTYEKIQGVARSTLEKAR